MVLPTLKYYRGNQVQLDRFESEARENRLEQGLLLLTPSLSKLRQTRLNRCSIRLTLRFTFDYERVSVHYHAIAHSSVSTLVHYFWPTWNSHFPRRKPMRHSHFQRGQPMMKFHFSLRLANKIRPMSNKEFHFSAEVNRLGTSIFKEIIQWDIFSAEVN